MFYTYNRQSEGWDPERIIEVPGCVDGVGLTMLAASVFQLVGAGLCAVQCVCHT